jgi:hypothetical protein
MDEDKRPEFVVHFRAEKDCADPVKALRQLLKRAWRSFGLKCIKVSEEN